MTFVKKYQELRWWCVNDGCVLSLCDCSFFCSFWHCPGVLQHGSSLGCSWESLKALLYMPPSKGGGGGLYVLPMCILQFWASKLYSVSLSSWSLVVYLFVCSNISTNVLFWVLPFWDVVQYMHIWPVRKIKSNWWRSHGPKQIRFSPPTLLAFSLFH